MKSGRNICIFAISAASLLLSLCPARAEEASVSLTLKDAVAMAVEKNLDIRAELYNPASAEADIHKYQGIYNPILSLQANYQDSSSQSANSFVSGGVSVNREMSTTYNAGVSRLIPSGATVGASFSNSWNQTNSASPGAINSYFQSGVTLSISQPLLKNFGRETTELTINVARLGKEGALEQFRWKLLEVVAQVKTQYYRLYSLRKNLEVKRTSLDLAETILANTRAQVNGGVLPAYEVHNAEFGVATQQKNLIDAERALRDQVDALRLLLQLRGAAEIIPTDTPFRDDYQVDEARAIQQALASRPDLGQQRVTLKTSELQSRLARNQTLPALDFTASSALAGLADTYNRDLERVGSGRYPAWSAGLQLTYPIGNDSAKNDYIKSRLKAEQTRTQVRSLEESVTNEVRAAVRGVRSGYRQLDVTARGRLYAEEVLQAYIRKQKVGLATTKDVLDELNNLVTAQGSEIQAVTDYNSAIVALWKATGELLEREGITLGEKDADSLYWKNSSQTESMGRRL